MDSNGGRKWESYSMDPNREWVKFYKQYKMMIIIIIMKIKIRTHYHTEFG